MSVEQGTKVYRRKDKGESLFLLIEGTVEARLKIGKHSYKRVAKFEPGAYFGEQAFIKPGRYEADAVAVEDVELLELRRSDLLKLDQEELSQLSLALLARFSRDMSDALRFAVREIRRLEKW